MDVAFDEVKGNVVGPTEPAPAESGGDAAPRPASAARQMREDLWRERERRARLQAD
jgi:hypothetical protein